MTEEVGISMHCPICGAPVTKYKESDHQYVNAIDCDNEFYTHRGDQLIKIKNPVSPFDNLINELNRSNG